MYLLLAFLGANYASFDGGAWNYYDGDP